MLIQERELEPLILNPSPNITKVIDEESFEKLIQFLENNKDFGYDVETTPVDDFWFRRMRTMQFGNANEQYVIDLKEFCDKNSELLFNCQGEYGRYLHLAPRLQAILKRLEKYLCTDIWVKTGVNLGFEYMCLYWGFGIRAYGWFDCMMAEKCIYAGLGGHASLKNYEFFSMGSMMERYFGKTIDKTLQTSFNLDDDISDEQWEYAALDTRCPLAIKMVQNLIASGETPITLKQKGLSKLADCLYYLDRIILGDNLHEVIKIENEAINSFIDMHLHGERIDTAKWNARTQIAKDKLSEVIKQLDDIFIPIVGDKHDTGIDQQIEKEEFEWKALNSPTNEEVEFKAQISALKRAYKKNPDNIDLRLQLSEVEIKLSQWESARKEQKEILKEKCSTTRKRRTKLKNLKDKCEGEALINYGSDAQLLAFLKENFKVLAKLENLDDEVLEKYESILVIKLIRQYHKYSKEVGTYGDSWAKRWTTKPGKEEGWLHPQDGRLHCEFNQYDAATGRSSSSQPNAQNLPQDKEIRSCFVADGTDETIRISNCCNELSYIEDIGNGDVFQVCTKCLLNCETHPEEFVLVTSDMSGAELRIIAEDSGDPVWINAFAKGEDVHSVGTELLYTDEWIKEALDDCSYFKLKENGEPQRKKCSCPLHKSRRDDNKSTNFLLAYGGGPSKLATEIKKSLKQAKELMALHEAKNPIIWQYLRESGEKASREFKAFDLFGRRRLLPEPTHERALANCKEYDEKKLRLPEQQCETNINVFVQIKGRKPKKDEEYELTHRQPDQKEIGHSFYQMQNSISRQGKNHRIQGTNASIAKIAMAILWHELPKYKARLVKFVHDELVINCPKRYGEKVAKLVGDAFKQAAALRMKSVIMEFDYHIASYWKK